MLKLNFNVNFDYNFMSLPKPVAFRNLIAATMRAKPLGEEKRLSAIFPNMYSYEIPRCPKLSYVKSFFVLTTHAQCKSATHNKVSFIGAQKFLNISVHLNK